MLLKLPTAKTVKEAVVALPAAVQPNYFGVMKVLDQNMSISTALPCRISNYEKLGKTILATLKPTPLLALFETPQLEAVARSPTGV